MFFKKMNLKFVSSSLLTTVALLAVFAGSEALAKETFNDIRDFKYVLGNGILQGMIAKELCSCRYVVGNPIEECKDRSSLPEMTFSVVTVMDDMVKKQVTVYPAIPLSDVPAMAIFDTESPRKGCRLVYGMKDASSGY
jgi:hypothetical protein